MAQRTVALYNNKYIGIETIYTVVNGQQINIPEKLKELREKSRKNELFCPCGCGANLVLVAGDKNLHEQHFREKSGATLHAVYYERNLDGLWEEVEIASRRLAEVDIINRLQQEKLQREIEFKKNQESNFTQQEKPIRDVDGNRWIKCEFCGNIAKDSEFSTYGGVGHINLGTCYQRSENNRSVRDIREKTQERIVIKKKFDSMECPECGGRLSERNGQYGRFYGCSNYPKCKYSRSIR